MAPFYTWSLRDDTHKSKCNFCGQTSAEKKKSFNSTIVQAVQVKQKKVVNILPEFILYIL